MQDATQQFAAEIQGNVAIDSEACLGWSPHFVPVFTPRNVGGVADQPTILLAEDSEDDVILIRRAFRKTKILAPLIAVRDGEEAISYLSGSGSKGRCRCTCVRWRCSTIRSRLASTRESFPKKEETRLRVARFSSL